MSQISLILHDLPKMDIIGWCDPYIKVYDQEQNIIHTTKIVKRAVNCVYDQFNIQTNQSKNKVLTFEVWDRDVDEEKDDFIGKVTESIEILRQNFSEVDQENLLCGHTGIYKMKHGGFLEIQILDSNDELDDDNEDLDEKTVNLAVILDNVRSKDFIGDGDPYFKAYHNNNLVRTSKVMKDQKNNVKFLPFTVHIASENDLLRLEIYDYDAIGSDDEIGTMEVTFAEILDQENDGVFEHSIKSSFTGRKRCDVKILDMEKWIYNAEADDYVVRSECPGYSPHETCYERNQEPIEKWHNVRIRKGGFYGKMYVLDSLGETGRWLNNVFQGGKDNCSIILLESCIYIQKYNQTNKCHLILWVVLFDKEFLIEEPVGRHVMVSNYDRRMDVKFETDEHAWNFYKKVQNLVKNDETVQFQLKQDDSSFAIPRIGSPALWFDQGRDYYWYLSEVLEKAEKEIYITDWWMNLEVLLKRPMVKYGPEYSLENILRRKAAQGVKVYIQLFSSPGEQMQLKLGGPRIKKTLNPVENIQVLHHGAGLTDAFLWSHHEKLCIIDQCVAFVGGIDLCSNRWDDDRYLLLDEKIEGLAENFSGKFGQDTSKDEFIHKEQGKLWNGKDYTNSFEAAGAEFDKWEEDLIDRKKTQRMPWQDIASVVYGMTAFDVGRHFIQRWNFTKMQQETSPEKVIDDFDSIKYLLPAKKSEILERSQKFMDIEPEEGRPFFFTDKSTDIPNLTVQPLRSFGNWSGGIKTTEHSIQDKYCKLIKESKKFVYIENQFFVTNLHHENNIFDQFQEVFHHNSQSEVKNKLGQAIVDRIYQAHQEKDEDFKIYIVIPLMPEFFGDIFKAETEAATLKTIMHYQYASICKENPELSDNQKNGTIFTRLKSLGVENPENYIHFSALRSFQKVTDTEAVTEVIYVHSKLLIVDDEHTIIGSANFNDRSQEGNRDSEFCLYFQDQSKSFAKSLRERLFAKYLGLANRPDSTSLEPNQDFFDNTWKKISNQNSILFEEIFRKAPNDSIRNYQQLKEYQKTEPLIKSDPKSAFEKLDEISGVLIDYPLRFLEEEWFHPNTLELGAESLAWSYGTFT